MSLRIGLFTHSTNPRGGVVHCLELGEALATFGHDVSVYAPDVSGNGFFRAARNIRPVPIPARVVAGDLADLVRRRVEEYVGYLQEHPAPLDIYHAHDGISGNALARVGVPFVRTVHHLDTFADPWLAGAQDRSITAAAAHLVVGRLWQAALRDRYEVTAAVMPSGVDTDRFRPGPPDVALRRRWGGNRSPIFLAVGGVERRKNTVNLLRAFQQVRRLLPNAALLVVGGATLMNHSSYRRRSTPKSLSTPPACSSSGP